MATTWKKAQESETEFWRSIYIEKRTDVPSYMPITDEAALAFSKKSVERFGQALNAISGKVIADVGCGPYGLIKGFQVFAKRVGVTPKKIYGADPLMDTFLTFGTLPRESYIEYIAARAESIPLPDSSCDCVYSTNVIDHVEDPDKVLKECCRICKVSGTFCFAVHVVNFPFSLLGPMLFLIDKNHPHHFREGYILRLAKKYFGNVDLSRKVTILDDHPEFTLSKALRSTEKLRGLKRWLSTFLLSTCYFKCSNLQVTQLNCVHNERFYNVT